MAVRDLGRQYECERHREHVLACVDDLEVIVVSSLEQIRVQMKYETYISSKHES